MEESALDTSGLATHDTTPALPSLLQHGPTTIGRRAQGETPTVRAAIMWLRQNQQAIRPASWWEDSAGHYRKELGQPPRTGSLTLGSHPTARRHQNPWATWDCFVEPHTLHGEPWRVSRKWGHLFRKQRCARRHFDNTNLGREIRFDKGLAARLWINKPERNWRHSTNISDQDYKKSTAIQDYDSCPRKNITSQPKNYERNQLSSIPDQ